MSAGLHHNSMAAFHGEQVALSAREQAILDWITAHGPHTDRQVMKGMGFLEPNSVRPRITALIEKRLLMEVGDVVCETTGKTVRRVDLRRARIPTVQMELAA